MSDTARRILATMVLAGILGVAAPLIVRGATHGVTAMSQPYVFVEPQLSIAVGDTVTWTMAAGDRHTVTSGTYNASGVHPDGLFDSGSLAPGDDFAFTFTTTGDYPYVCAIHADSGMVGRITVTAGGPSPDGERTPVPGAGGGAGAEPVGAIGGLLVAIALAAGGLLALGWRVRSRRRA